MLPFWLFAISISAKARNIEFFVLCESIKNIPSVQERKTAKLECAVPWFNPEKIRREFGESNKP